MDVFGLCIIIVVFDGWNDVGEVVSGVVEVLCLLCEYDFVYLVDFELYFDY